MIGKAFLSDQSQSLSLEVVDNVFPHALDLHFFLLVLLRADRVLDQELMEGAILGRILEHSFLLFSDEIHHIVELHQHSSVGNCEDMLLLLRVQVFVVDDVLLDQQLQEFAASLVDVHPALAFLALVGSQVLALLVGHLLPSAQRLPLQNASAFLSDHAGESSGDLLKVVGFEFDVVEGGLGSAQIRDINVIKVDGMFVEKRSYFLRLFLPQFGEHARLLSANGALAVVLSLSVAREEQPQCGNVLLHSNYMTLCKDLTI